ncbi:DNA repair protein (Rad57), putative [Paecilomyces variotii No. 5]|uniref:DNA repair protein (Rad57), putative n=1 Tax=Byssochlamys spectabilis (strain No. 5 / NBRC 109023) TaxID=1356009 RepID=V5FD13_BYSSN|nr:DNA repair protein (Rad57), putative [Paecilomyces variotii No. 5]
MQCTRWAREPLNAFGSAVGHLATPADAPSRIHMDLLSVLPGFSTKSYNHILPSLEKKHITTVDLITLDPLEVAKRAHVPPGDVRRLSAQVLQALHRDLGFQNEDDQRETETGASENVNGRDTRGVEVKLDASTKLDPSRWRTISTLDSALDALLGGGIPTGYLTEVTGESASGKTQFLLNLLLAVQVPSPGGLGKRAIYVSTEAPLATTRLSQIIECHPHLSSLPAKSRPSLQNILSINAIDLETQDHILNYQLPVAISRYNVGLVIIDSIAANYRAEHTSTSMLGLSARSGELAKLGQMLRNLAVEEDIAVVVANQVSDRFDSLDAYPRTRAGQMSSQFRESGGASPSQKSRLDIVNGEINPGMPSPSQAVPSSPYVDEENSDGSYLIGNPVRNEILSLARQQQFFTGWGDVQPSWDQDLPYQTSSNKIPALGFVWSTQIACRIVLKKEDDFSLADIAALSQVEPTPSSGGQLPVTQKETTAIEPQSDVAKSEESQTAEVPLSSSQKPDRITRRRMKLAFAPWAAGVVQKSEADADGTKRTIMVDEVPFEIWKGGIRSIEEQ